MKLLARRWDLVDMEMDDLAPLVDLRFKLIQSLPEDSKECIRASIIEQIGLAIVVTSSSSEDGENDVQIVEPLECLTKV